jgi:hypothetical protein
MLHQKMTMVCRLTRSSAGSVVVRPGSALLRRGAEAQWLPRAAAVSRKPGDIAWPRNLMAFGLVPRKLDSKLKPHAIPSMISLSPFLSRFTWDSL